MKKHLPLISIIIASVLWGSMSIFANELSRLGLPSASISCVRLSIAGILLWIILGIFKKDALKVKLKHLPLLLSIGALSQFLMSVCYISAITTTSASVAAILLYTSPIFIFVFSVILFKEKATKNKLIALVLSVAGCVFVSGIVNGGNFSTEGILLGLASGLTYGLYSILGTYALKHYSAITVTAYSFLASTILSVIFLDYGALSFASTVAPSVFYFVIICVFSAVVTALLPFGLYTYGLQGMDASKAGILACVEPVVATLVGIFVLGEGTDVFQIIGVVLVILAIVLLQLPSRKDRNKITQIE